MTVEAHNSSTLLRYETLKGWKVVSVSDLKHFEVRCFKGSNSIIVNLIITSLFHLPADVLEKKFCYVKVYDNSLKVYFIFLHSLSLSFNKVSEKLDRWLLGHGALVGISVVGEK